MSCNCKECNRMKTLDKIKFAGSVLFAFVGLIATVVYFGLGGWAVAQFVAEVFNK